MAMTATQIAYPEWTEYRKKNGLDPLGMQTSSISIYQSLMPGISNVTLRVRYYGLYAWLSRTYAQKVGATDPTTWQRFIRRSEALYALVAQRHGNETGVAGIMWAQRKLETAGDADIDFADDAEPGSPTYYLKQAWGAYGAAYASQLYEIGVFAQVEGHGIPVPGAQFGDRLADSFSVALGPLADVFFESIQKRRVSIPDLDALSPITPSEIENGSDERACYEDILFAEAGLTRDPDMDRRRSLLLILELSRHLERIPSVFDIRWILYAGCDTAGRPVVLRTPELEAQSARWWVYQANDLMHISYEALLKWTLDRLETYKAGITLSHLIAEAVEGISEAAEDWPKTWAHFLEMHPPPLNPLALDDKISDRHLSETVMRVSNLNRSSSPEEAWSALRLLAVLHNRVRIGPKDPSEELGALDPTAFRSLLTEVRFLEKHLNDDFSDLVTKLIEQRVVRRHLWVALRKLRHQGDYTFLIEADDGRVRLKVKDGPVFTNPRLGPAVTFLKDIHLIDEQGLTDHGKRVLEGA